MSARNGAFSDGDGARDGRVLLWYLVPLGLVAGILLVGVIAISTLNGSGGSTDAAKAASEAARKLPPYWTVHSGDTYSRIAARTGLSVDELETFNPQIDPTTILPGQRIKLRLHAPKPRPKSLGPTFWTVRTGQSYGSIAAKTGKPIGRLIALNPRLKPTALRPGDRVRLRR
ncbi:MAG: hypothetical protein QOJ35_175 [Solirubrobacteraceae bacterium]|jgi:LysM repeat protein|nr:hypothetical protein [Solirubrobacteraceae bacterium]